MGRVDKEEEKEDSGWEEKCMGCEEEEGVDVYGEETDAGDGENEGEGEHADTGTTTAGVEMVKCGRTTIDLLPLYSIMGRGKVIWVPCMLSDGCWYWWCCS